MLLAGVLNNPLPGVITELNLPCYFVMGKYDYMISSNAATNYFDLLEADQNNLLFLNNPHIIRILKRR